MALPQAPAIDRPSPPRTPKVCIDDRHPAAIHAARAAFWNKFLHRSLGTFHVVDVQLRFAARPKGERAETLLCAVRTDTNAALPVQRSNADP